MVVMRLIVSTDVLKWATAMNNSHKYMLMLLQLEYEMLMGKKSICERTYIRDLEFAFWV